MYQLITNNTIALRKPCEKVSRKQGSLIGRKLISFINHYNKTHVRKQALGLAAPQLGIYKQVCTVAFDSVPFILINPRIINHSTSKFSWNEGCLSFPGKTATVFRYHWIEVTCSNWQESRFFGPHILNKSNNKFCGKIAESGCIQHEIAHLAGLLFTDFTKEDFTHPSEWFTREN